MSSSVPRTIFMGMLGEFSAIPLERMLQAGMDVCAVVVSSASVTSSATPISALIPPPLLPADLLLQAEDQRNIIQLAWAQHIPVFAVSNLRHAQTFTTLAESRPDVIVVACFPFVLPARYLKLPTYGCFNLHPSLLPKLRGPAPLFWTFHEGAQPGVTLHLMTERVDAGEIVAQTPLAFPDGISYADAERICAQAGTGLILDALRVAKAGRLQMRPQTESDATYFPYPSRNDFLITPAWSARRVFNFIRGIAGFGGPAIIQIEQAQFTVREAVGYKTGELMAQGYRVEGDKLWVRCVDGVIHMRIVEH